MSTETFREFLVRLGFEAGQHVGSSSSYHYGTPKKVDKYAVLYPIRVDWSPQRGPLRAYFFTVWLYGKEVYDGLGEPDRGDIWRMVQAADREGYSAEGDGGSAAG